jgi:hypothetical protein
MRGAMTSKFHHPAGLLVVLALAGCGGIDATVAGSTAPGHDAAPAAQPVAEAADAASAATGVAPPSATQRLPGLAGRNVRASDPGHYQAIPSSVAGFLLSLPASDVQVPLQVLQQILQAKAFVVDIAHGDGLPDHQVTATNDPGHGYWLWLRSFRSDSEDATYYLVQLSLRCDVRADAAAEAQAKLLQGACAQPGRPAIDTGLLAYRVIAGGAPENVTRGIANPATVLGSEVVRRYEELGASGLFADDSRFHQVPVLRWVMELDPEHPLPASDPRAFDHGSRVHAGFVVWTGNGFASSDTVPRSHWPCPKRSPSLCTDDDRFVSDGE